LWKPGSPKRMIGLCFEVLPPRTQEFPQQLRANMALRAERAWRKERTIFLGKKYPIRKRYVNLASAGGQCWTSAPDFGLSACTHRQRRSCSYPKQSSVELGIASGSRPRNDICHSCHLPVLFHAKANLCPSREMSNFKPLSMCGTRRSWARSNISNNVFCVFKR